MCAGDTRQSPAVEQGRRATALRGIPLTRSAGYHPCASWRNPAIALEPRRRLPIDLEPNPGVAAALDPPAVRDLVDEEEAEASFPGKARLTTLLMVESGTWVGHLDA